MHPTMNIAVRAARAGGSVILRYMERLERINVREKAPNDFVSEVDRQAEEEIIFTLAKSFPHHCVLAEEGGISSYGEGMKAFGKEALDQPPEFLWIIDPLDGTTNYLHGFPQFAVSIALQEKGKLTQGVIFDPISQEIFTATRGEGAYLNERRIRVSKRQKLRQSLIGTGFPFRENANVQTYLRQFGTLIPEVEGIRRAGAAALDLAWVAAGRLDGFWESGLSCWDIAAGAILIEEAGGIITDLEGDKDYLKSGGVISGNARIHRELRLHLQKHG